MDAAARAAGMRDVPDTTADPSRDVETGNSILYRHSLNHSRVSLPHSITSPGSRRPSTSQHRRYNSQQSQQLSQSGPALAASNHTNSGTLNTDAELGESDDLEWGPLHPCFPHPNPHVPLTSPLYQTTRIIRIKRDWLLAGDVAPTFSQLYPEVLESFLPETKFRELMGYLNNELIRIFNPWRPRAWIDAIVGVATGWLWDDFGMTGVKKELAKLETWLEKWNQEVLEPEGCRVIPLRRTAYLCLDIQIPDPQLPTEAELGAGGESQSEWGDMTDAGNTNGLQSTPSKRGSSLGMNGRTRFAGPKSDYGSSQASGSLGRRQPNDWDGPRPVVPPIPGKYLAESRPNGQR